MSEFKVGEVAIGQNFEYFPEHNGMECEIIGGLAIRMRMNSHDGTLITDHCYIVVWANGVRCTVSPGYLRKRNPPATDTSAQEYAALIERLTQRVPA
jgi:hypothetical protein